VVKLISQVIGEEMPDSVVKADDVVNAKKAKN
jgi:hypothetical protein